MKIFKLAVLLCTLAAAADAFAKEYPEKPEKKVDPAVHIEAQPFPLNRVRLLDSSFKAAMEKNLEYLLLLDVDRMLWPYHERAGMPMKGERYGGWEQKDLVGQTSGHYLTALSLMYASTGNTELKHRIDYMVSEMAKAQEKHGNGYVGPVRPEVWNNTFDGSIEVHKWGLGGGYVPWYVVHKTYAGLIDAYTLAGNKQALTVVCTFADWAKKCTATLSDEAFQETLLAEHGGMAEAMANLYEVTGNEDYLALAQRFEHKQITHPLAEGRDELTGKHVNTQLPKITGSAQLYKLTGEERFAATAKYLWDRIVNTRMFASGGVELREHFYEAGKEAECLDWNSAETCSVYNMLKLTRHLFSWQADAKYMDYYERALYNQILGSQDPISGGFTYFYSLRPGHFKIYSTPFDSMWCCVGTGMENHSKYADTIYSHNDTTLWVNLFIPSELDWRELGVTIRQETNFPDDDTMNFSFATTSPKKFTMKIRVPYWATDGASVWINGRQEEVQAMPQSYLALSRTWQDGDTVKVRLPMSLHLHRARDKREMAVVMYGPLTLAGELGTVGMPTDVCVSQSAHSGMMDPPVPHLLVDDKDLSSCVKRMKGELLRFKTEGIGSPQDVTLVPLHALHHQRYTVYWNTMPSEPPKTLEPANVSEQHLARGLDYKYYEGRWELLPDFRTLEAEESGVAEDFDISKRKRNDDFGFVFSGYLKIAGDGEYYFASTSDDGSSLSLSGTEVVTNDGIHGMISKSSGPFELKAGFYPLKVTFFEQGGGEGLELKFYDVGGQWRRIPQSMLYRPSR